MSGSLTHAPANILRSILVELGIGTLPTSSGSWPIYYSNMPDTPDSAIVIVDTTSRLQGRTHYDGVTVEKQGVNIQIRDANELDGYEKASGIQAALDASIRNYSVTLTDPTGTSTSTYTVHAVTLTTGIISLGKDTPQSKRNLFSLNAVMSIKQTA